MGVYTKGTNLDLQTGIIECTMEPGMEAAINIVAEGEMNYNAIMQAVGVHELAIFESTGVEMVYEASDVKGFVDKVKQFFKNLLEKIKGLFKKFFAMLNSYIKTDKEFINKYKKHLLQVNTKDFEYKGFKFTDLDYSIEKAGRAAESIYINKIKDGLDSDAKSDMVEEMRGKAIGSGSLDSTEFTKEVYKLFRNDEDSKETLENISVVTEIQNIDGSANLKKDAEKTFSELEKRINLAIRTIEKESNTKIKLIPGKESVTDAAASDVKYISDLSYFMKEELAILQVINGAKLTAIKDQNRQSKSICVSLMNYKPKNESYSFIDSTNESFLSDVVLR